MKKLIMFLFILTAFTLIIGTTACDEGNFGEDTTTPIGGGTGGGGDTGGGDTGGGTTDPVQLDTPGDILATDGEFTTKVIITWSSVDNSSSYAVYRSDPGDDTFNLISSEEGVTETNFTDTDVDPDSTYYYKVQALSSSSSYTASELSNADDGFARDGLDTVTGVSATDGILTDAIGLTWDEVPGATHYIVYRSSSASGTFEEIGQVAAADLNSSTPGESEDPEDPEESDPVHLDFTSNVNLNNSYLLYAEDGVLVTAWITFQLQIIIGTTVDATIEFSGGIWGEVYTQAEIIEMINTEVGFELCTPVDGDSEGTIKYLTMSVDNEPLIFKNYSNNRAIMKFLMQEVDDKDQMVIINGDGTTVIDESEYTGNPLDYVTTDDSGDDGDDGDGDDDVSPYYYSDMNSLETNQPYYYKVEAVEKNEGGDTLRYSDLSEADSGYIGELQAPSVPENISASDEASSNYITITWDAVSNAEYYRVYMSDLEGGEYSLITGSGDITGTSYTYSTTAQGTYYFKVEAFNLAGGSGLSDSDAGSIAPVVAISNRDFLELYLQTESNLMDKIHAVLGNPPLGNETIDGDVAGTCDFHGGLGDVTVTYNSYQDFTIIIDGVTTTVIKSLTPISGTTTGTLTISGDYSGTIELNLTVNVNGANGGSYTVTQTGGSPETINFSDL